MIDTFDVLDVETTGLNYGKDRIIEWGWAVFDKRNCVWVGSNYVQSDVPNSGQHVNNITPEQIAGGESQKTAINFLHGVLRKAVEKRRPICAYNASFDLSFMAYSFARCGLKFDFGELRVLDPLVIHRHYDRKDWAYRAGARKLARMAERYSLKQRPDHTAGADAHTAGLLQIELNYHFPFGSYSATQLHELQKKWAKEWGIGLKNLVHPKPVRLTEWPVEEPYTCHLSPSGQQSLSLESS